MNTRLRLSHQYLVATLLLFAYVVDGFADDFPGGNLDRRIIKTQQKVDSLFEKGDYERAYFIYRQELAPLGDKYAQYMVGYMTIVGKGTAQDYIAGSAWYRLAAERGEKHFAKARDELLGYFSAEQMQQSDQEYAELRLLYSDAVIVTNLIEQDLNVISRHASSASLNYAPSEPDAVSESESLRLAAAAQERIAVRLDYLTSALASGDLLSADEQERVEEIAHRARSVVEQSR